MRLRLLLVLFSLVVGFFLPSFVFVAGAQSSLASGFVVSSMLVLILLWRNMLLSFSRDRFLFFFVIVLFVLLDALVSLYFSGDFKPFYSLVLVFPLLVSCFLYEEFLSLDDSEWIFVFKFMFLLLCFVGALRFFYRPDFLNYWARPKQVFPFSEESHYALSMGLFALPLISVVRIRYALLVLLVLLGFGVLYPSLTFLVFFALGGVLISLRSRLFFIAAVVGVMVGLPIVLNVEYFASRLTFSENNLTSLVFLQGLELMRLAYSANWGGGLGFQMLGGGETPILDVSEKIYLISGRYMNLDDGGFLAAKIISEFGYIGVGLVVGYILVLLRVFHFLLFGRIDRKDICPPFSMTKLRMAGGVILGFFVELFLRGYGYFSPTLFFFLIFLFVFIRARSQGRGSDISV